MSTEIVQVDKDRVVIALGRLRLGLRENEELMRILGAAQLASVRRTFRDQGSPAGSWQRLSPNTIKRNPKKYGAGHKLLVDSGRLLNSITFATFAGGVRIGTNVIYARVHQLGSADRTTGTVQPKAPRKRGSLRTGKRAQNIPARPYLVFRPEDPARLRALVVNYINGRAASAGLKVGGAQ